MEEPKECDLIGSQVESDCNVKQRKMYKLYQLMSLSMSCITQEIDKLKNDEDLINYELMMLPYRDWDIEPLTDKIKYIQGALKKGKPHLPISSLPWTNTRNLSSLINLTENERQTPEQVELRLGTSVKRCHNRLKKETMDLEYLHDVQKQLLLMKSSGKQIHGLQEVNNVKKSLVDRIQHGSKNLANEHKIFHEIEKINETIEIYSAPTQPQPQYCRYYSRRRYYSRPINWAEIIQSLNIDKRHFEKDQKEHNDKVSRLKADQDQVRKTIRRMERALEKVCTKMKKVYKCSCKHEQQNFQESSYNDEYQLLMKKVKQLARNGDAVGLLQIFDMQI